MNKNYKKTRAETGHKSILLALAILFIIAFLVENVSAFDFLPVKNYVDDGSKYGKIEINNFLGIGNKIEEVTLDINTEKCWNGECYAEGKITISSNG